MTYLIIIKQHILNFIGRYEVYVKPVGKLILSILVLAFINGKLGYMSKIDNMAIVLIVGLMCSFMPINFILLMGGLFLVLHMYALSIECAIVTVVLLLVLYLIYFRLAPGDTVAVALTPILSSMGIPYVIPVSLGLSGGPASGASVACGVIIYRIIHSMTLNAGVLAAMESDDMATRFRLIIDNILADKGLILLSVVVVITVLVVNIISQLPIDYSWIIAVVAGSIIQAVMVLIGNSVMHSDLSAGGLIIGTILAIAVGMVVQFILFDLDYKRTEKLEFQDDDYVYYVKAVPKRSVRIAKKKKK